MYPAYGRLLFCRVMSIFLLFNFIKNVSFVSAEEAISKKVFIDQGHNPRDKHGTGAEGCGIYEGDINFNVGKKIKDMLENMGNFEVILSRPDEGTVLGSDRSSSLSERVNKANELKADISVSIHCNAFENEKVNGTECYIYDDSEGNKLRYDRSNLLASLVLQSIVSRLDTTSRGVKNGEFRLIKETKMPAILVELAFITNDLDAIRLRDRQGDFASSMCQGIVEYFKKISDEDAEFKSQEGRSEVLEKKQGGVDRKEKLLASKGVICDLGQTGDKKPDHKNDKVLVPTEAKREGLDKKTDSWQLEGTFSCEIILPPN